MDTSVIAATNDDTQATENDVMVAIPILTYLQASMEQGSLPRLSDLSQCMSQPTINLHRIQADMFRETTSDNSSIGEMRPVRKVNDEECF